MTNSEYLDKLIKQISENNKEAFEQLYNETKTAVYAYALSVLKNSADAEDVLHDTFLSIHTSAASYKSIGKPMAWIMTVTKNLCMQKFRDAKKRVNEEYSEPFLSDSPELSVENKAIITDLLNKLSDEEREILVLHAVSGFKHREIAEFTDLPLSTVLSKYNRTVKKCKKILEEGDAFNEQ